jgi:hypothetical protein
MVGAQSISINENPEYANPNGGEAVIEYNCDGSCPDSVQFNIDACDEEANIYDSSDGTMTHSFLIPGDDGNQLCGLGSKQVEVTGSSGVLETFTFRVKGYGTGDTYVFGPGPSPHVAKNIFVNYAHGGNNLKAFQMTNDQIDSVSIPGQSYGDYATSGNIMIHEYRGALPSKRNVIKAEFGNIAGDDESLGHLVYDDPDDASCDKVGCDTLGVPFNTQDPKTITTSNTKTDNGVGDNLDSAFPLHGDNGNFKPEGDIVYADYPNYSITRSPSGSALEPAHSGEGSFFFVCRDGANMVNSTNLGGTTTPQVVDIGGSGEQDLLKCQDDGTWDSVTECNDGLDNDGDNKIDDADPACETGDTEDGGGNCDVLGYNSNDNIELNYTDSGSCVSETLNSFIYDSDGTVKSPETFTCDGANAENKGGDAVPSGNQYDEFCTTAKSDPHGGEIQAVEFYPTKQSLEAIYGKSNLEEGVNIENEIPPTGFDNNARYFIGEDGWQSGLQTLHQAEGMYGSGDLHSELTWSAKGMVNTGGYDGSGDYSDAWGISNGGSPFTGVEETQFHGGFHGKCGSGENWTKKQGIWRCSGAGAQGIQVNFYNLDPENTDNYVGFELNASQASNWGELYGVPAVPSSGGAENLEIKARCWQGEPAQRPTNQEDLISLSKQVTSDDPGSGNTNIIAGQLPPTRDWSGVGGPAGGTDTYSCNFGFQQEVFFPSLIPSNDDIFDESGSLVTNPLSCDTSGRCFIIAGSDQNVVQVTVNQEDVISSQDIQDKLENAATSTDNAAYDSVFSAFPTAQGDIRNPFAVWDSDY